MTWLRPPALIARGFDRSRVVMLNEGHNGWSRCVRTRRMGLEVLPAAHAAGCRHLAKEAPPTATECPTWFTELPPVGGYLAQAEMLDLVGGTVASGWTLVGYEPCWATSTTEHRADATSMAAINEREDQQAGNLAAALDRVPPTAGLLVWCGNGHHSKRAIGAWRPMGLQFALHTGIDPFCIDQLTTLALAEGHRSQVPLTPQLVETLEALGGTAGFVAGDPPPGFAVPDVYDAWIMSTDNEMVEGPAPPLPPRSG